MAVCSRISELPQKKGLRAHSMPMMKPISSQGNPLVYISQ